MISYNEIYQTFLLNCGYDFDELPQTDSLRYKVIKNAVMHYNQLAKKYSSRIQGNVICDDGSESINVQLTDNELLILAYIIAENIAKTKLVEFNSLYGTYSSELGFKDYKAQCEIRQYTIDMFKTKYMDIIHDEMDTFNIGG